MTSATQAWCRLAVLIAEGAPAPERISVDDDRVSVDVRSADEFGVWLALLGPGAFCHEPFTASSGRTLYSAHASDWHGRQLWVTASVGPEAVEPEVDGMATVREVARGRQFVGPGELERSGYSATSVAECSGTANCSAHPSQRWAHRRDGLVSSEGL